MNPIHQPTKTPPNHGKTQTKNGIAPGIVALAEYFRWVVVRISVVIVSAVVICTAEIQWAIVVSMLALAIVLANLFVKLAQHAFSKTSAYAKLASTVTKVWNWIDDKLIITGYKSLEKYDVGSREYATTLTNNYLFTYLAATCLQWAGDKLERVIDDRKIYTFLVLSLFATFFFSVFVFALEYVGLNKLDSAHFGHGNSYSMPEFLGFSLSMALFSAVTPIEARSGLAQVVAHFETGISPILIAFFATFFVQSLTTRYRDDLKTVVARLKDAESSVRRRLSSEYSITWDELESTLIEGSLVLVNMSRKMRGLDPLVVPSKVEADADVKSIISEPKFLPPSPPNPTKKRDKKRKP